jgi:hypothetical protein
MSGTMEALAAIETGAKFGLYSLDVLVRVGEPHGLSLAKMLETRQPAAKVIFITGDHRLNEAPSVTRWTLCPRAETGAPHFRAVATCAPTASPRRRRDSLEIGAARRLGIDAGCRTSLAGELRR